MSLRIEPSMYLGRYTLLEKVLVGECICTDEAGSSLYPASEACYANIKEWELATGRDFHKEFGILVEAGAGSQ